MMVHKHRLDQSVPHEIYLTTEGPLELQVLIQMVSEQNHLNDCLKECVSGYLLLTCSDPLHSFPWCFVLC